ncbi:hypothetical protein SDJN02_04085, partial [Cucurbita argyrosperma subsp. argyrosperma]
MVDGLISGAIAGVVAEVMLKKLLSSTERAIRFKRVREDMRYRLQNLSSEIKQVKHGGFLDFPQYMTNVQQLIDKGKKLIAKCDAVDRSILRYPKVPYYTKKLRKLGDELERTKTDLTFKLMLQNSTR